MGGELTWPLFLSPNMNGTAVDYLLATSWIEIQGEFFLSWNRQGLCLHINKHSSKIHTCLWKLFFSIQQELV